LIANPLDALLAEAATARERPAPSTELNAALDDLAVRIKRVPLQRRPGRQVLVAAAIAGSVALGTPAAAGWVSARTGWFGSSGMTESDSSEWLRADSPEMPGIVEDHGRAYPLPPGGSYAGVVERLRGGAGRTGPALVQDTGVRALVAWESVCQWEAVWLAADEAGDADRRRQAATILDDSAGWPIFSQVDGGGVLEWRRMVGSSAAEGTRAPVEQDFRANCAGQASQARR
jgi:hypothetical protein